MLPLACGFCANCALICASNSRAEMFNSFSHVNTLADSSPVRSLASTIATRKITANVSSTDAIAAQRQTVRGGVQSVTDLAQCSPHKLGYDVGVNRSKEKSKSQRNSKVYEQILDQIGVAQSRCFTGFLTLSHP